MKVIPIMRCSNIAKSLSFYTDVLDFEVKNHRATAQECIVTIQNGVAEMQLSVADGVFGNHVNIRVDNIHALFKKYVKRGLQISHAHISPLNNRTVNQSSYNMREFLVNDPDGNTLRFVQPI